MKNLTVLKSKQDASVNFVEQQLEGFLESRYVRRRDDYFVCYLSSQTGCNRGCKFCHLTVTGQTSFKDSTFSDFMLQFERVLDEYRASTAPPAKYMHYSFMARGEPLENEVIRDLSFGLFTALANRALANKLPAKFNISTIMPKTIKKSLVETFPIITPTIYYSLYSVREDFRKEWLPAAMPVRQAIELLAEYQRFSKKIVKIHHALIDGQNDTREDAAAIADELARVKLQCEFNLVRYNPASPEQGKETTYEKISKYMNVLEFFLPNRVKMIPRVGFDVKASCGMFVK